MNYILSILEANPTLYIGEIQQRLLEAQDCNVSIATICCAVRRLVLTHKKVAWEALERDESVWATWVAEYRDVPMHTCIWLDELSIDDCTNQLQNVYAACGCVLFRDKDFQYSLPWVLMESLHWTSLKDQSQKNDSLHFSKSRASLWILIDVGFRTYPLTWSPQGHHLGQLCYSS